MKALRTDTTSRRRARPRKVESYADWMARVDREVDEAARQLAKRRPSPYPSLHPAQRQIVNLLIELLRSLPARKPGENAWRKPEYREITAVLMKLFEWKFPAYKQGGRPQDLPAHELTTLFYLLDNCAGEAPVQEVLEADDDED